MPSTNRPESPTGFVPHLTCAGAADAIAFYVRAFGAEELGRLAGPDGRLMHAMLRIGDGFVMLHDEMPEHGALGPLALKGTAVSMHRYVPDVDAAFARAVEAGATVAFPLADQFWGDRYGMLQDPWGHRWSLATHLRDVSPDEMKAAMAAMAAAGDAQGCAGDAPN